MKAKPKLDLSYYWNRFEDALRGRYEGKTFSKASFAEIKRIYADVRLGKLSLQRVP
jgi:hypothetical protein